MQVRFTVPVSWVARTLTGIKDSYGNDVYTDTPVSTQGVFAPGGSTETTQGGDTVVTQPTVYLPDMAVTPVDRIVVNGETFEVDGQPRNWPANAFTGWRPDYPLEVPLRRVTG